MAAGGQDSGIDLNCIQVCVRVSYTSNLCPFSQGICKSSCSSRTPGERSACRLIDPTRSFIVGLFQQCRTYDYMFHTHPISVHYMVPTITSKLVDTNNRAVEQCCRARSR
jgi:hypothetical protein